jgi:replicative DNA helicase
MTAISAKVSMGYARRHQWEPGEEDRYHRHYQYLAELPLVLPAKNQTPRTGTAICAWITRQVRHHGIRVAYIDHIDAVRLELDRGTSLAGGYADLMKRLQELAGREQITIVFQSQVNREVRREDKDAKTPPMAYLREAGAKEEASQTVLMLGLEKDTESNNEMWPVDGQWLWVNIDKLKDYPGNRNVGRIDNPHRPIMYLDARSGAIRERSEQLF